LAGATQNRGNKIRLKLAPGHKALDERSRFLKKAAQKLL
jgi:hypothetical protein